MPFFRQTLARPLAAAACAAGLLAAAPSLAAQAGDFYVQGNVASSWGTGGLGQSGAWGFAAGSHLTRNIRVEAAIDWRDGYRYDADFGAPGRGSFDLDSVTYMANAYWDFYDRRRRARGLTPFVGLGAGLAQVEAKGGALAGGTLAEPVEAAGRTSDRFAWQGMAGFNLDTGEFAFARFGYRYINQGRAELTAAAERRSRTVQGHELFATLGARF